jgi:hypothetical protein
VVNLLVALTARRAAPFDRALAREAVRLRAADNALRAGLRLAKAPPEPELRAKEDAFPVRLGKAEADRAEAEGAALTLEEAVAALHDALAKIR